MKKNCGFTLVELIVVLVILAILAAVLVPALLGYIDKAKEKEDINRAKACLDAAQGGFVEAYAKDKPIDEAYNVLGLPVEKKHGSYNDIDATESDVAKLVKNCTDEDPYIFMVAAVVAQILIIVSMICILFIMHAMSGRKTPDLIITIMVRGQKKILRLEIEKMFSSKLRVKAIN